MTDSEILKKIKNELPEVEWHIYHNQDFLDNKRNPVSKGSIIRGNFFNAQEDGKEYAVLIELTRNEPDLDEEIKKTKNSYKKIMEK